jgi:hypothetical protein
MFGIYTHDALLPNSQNSVDEQIVAIGLRRRREVISTAVLKVSPLTSPWRAGWSALKVHSGHVTRLFGK